MTGRWRVVSLTMIVVAGLFAWQWSRDRKIADCIDTNGVWDGARSICVPARGGPIIMRDLRRT
jgi:hypothetical protein